MAKASTRFRNRKINFKTRITVRTGSHALDYDDDGADGEVEFEEDKSGSAGGPGTVDTGVDKEEEGEVHLQAALASSTASVSRSSAYASGSRGGPSSPSKAAPKAFIPTPDSRGTIDDETFASLYPQNAWVDPVTYVRFSDTVEDAQIGAANYNMDEDDEDWLEAYNATAGPPTTAQAPESGKPLDPVPNGTTTPGRGQRDRKGKGAEKTGREERREASTILVGGPIGEDDFELIMETFERVTEEKVPMAHVDTELLPAFADFEATLSDRTLKPPLDHLKSFARAIYPHWKARRLKRGGKSIIPQLDYDESNESNPYVCFRRRELKTSRKTRRSDQQNLDRLIRLRNDLYAAHALMVKTRDRERLKLDSIETDRKIFEGRVELRELKRRLGENEGDEDILIGRKEKRRRKDEPPQANGMRVSLGRKPDAIFSPTSLITSVEDLRVRKERAANIASRMDRDLAKKRESDQLWEDWTDIAFLTRQPSYPARYWRAVEAVPGSSSATTGTDALGFTQHQAAIGPARTSFRRRVGRGGRVMLDRIAPHRSRPVPPLLRSDGSGAESDDEDEDPAVVARRLERFRYDSDAGLDFPSTGAPAVIDDFELKYTLKRASLLRPADIEFLAPDNSYLEEAYRWVSQEPERPQPPLVYGRLPPRAPLQVQPGGPGGVPMQVPPGGTPQQTQAYGQMQMMAAASQAHRMAQHQANLKRQQVGGPPSDPMRKTPSNNGSPVGQSPMQLPMPMPMALPMNGNAPVQAQWMNGMPTKVDGNMVHLQHHLPPQRLPNGLVAVPSHPNGANGMPATSRLSNPPLQGMQQGSPGMQQRPPSAASHHQPPSRPGSAQSSHHSPSLAAQSLPGQQPLQSPNGLLAANGKRSSPSMHANFPPGLQAGVSQGVLKHQMQSLPYGGFVGAQT